MLIFLNPCGTNKLRAIKCRFNLTLKFVIRINSEAVNTDLIMMKHRDCYLTIDRIMATGAITRNYTYTPYRVPPSYYVESVYGV